MEKAELQKLTAKLIHARQMMLGQFTASSCILTVRIVRDILREFGVRSQPMAVRVTVFNEAYMQKAAEMGRHPENVEETVKWERECGAWVVGVVPGEPARENRWNGHLVNWLPEHRVFCDLSSDQFDRPQHNIEVPPAVYEVPDGWEDGTEEGSLVDQLDTGTVVHYMADPKNKGFLPAADWRAVDGRGQDIIRATINLIRLTS